MFQRRIIGDCWCETFAGHMAFLLPKQRCQSTKVVHCEVFIYLHRCVVCYCSGDKDNTHLHVNISVTEVRRKDRGRRAGSIQGTQHELDQRSNSRRH